MSETNSQWADDLVADSDAALRRLCAAVRSDAPELPSSSVIAESGRHLAGPSGGTSASILDALSALRTMVVGAADLANARTRAIVDTFSRDDSDGWTPDPGVLFRRGEQALRRVSAEFPE